MFGFSSPAYFKLDGIALAALKVGSIAAGSGLLISMWLIAKYSTSTRFRVSGTANTMRDRV